MKLLLRNVVSNRLHRPEEPQEEKKKLTFVFKSNFRIRRKIIIKMMKTILFIFLKAIFAQSLRTDLARFIVQSDCVMITFENKTNIDTDLITGKLLCIEYTNNVSYYKFRQGTTDVYER